jgi:hypothetical protein
MKINMQFIKCTVHNIKVQSAQKIIGLKFFNKINYDHGRKLIPTPVIRRN